MEPFDVVEVTTDAGLYLIELHYDDDPIEYYDEDTDSYKTWDGEAYGFVAKAPNGDHVDSCWSFDDLVYMRDEAIGSVKYDAEQRVKRAALVGAGFVGII